MDEASTLLHRQVRRAARRLSWQRAFSAGLLAGAAVLAGVAAAALAAVIIPLDPVPPAVAASAALLAVAAVSALVAWARPVGLLTAACLLDARAGLEERASTALEVSGRAQRGLLSARLVDDAARRAGAVDLRTAFPWRAPRTMYVMAALMALLLVWPTTLRGFAIPGTPAHRTREAIRREGGRLEQFARALQSRTRGQRMPQSRRVAPEIRDLGDRLRQERIDRAEALSRIAELSRRIEEARREIDGRLGPQRPQDGAAAPPQDQLRRQALQQQIRQLRELTNRLQQSPQTATPDALQRLGEITREGEGDQPAQARRNLEQAREQLERGNVPGASQSLEQALRELEGLESMLADREGLRSAQRQLERSQQAIGSPGGERAGAEPSGDPSDAQDALEGPGDQRPSQDPGADALPPQGPNEGTTPGQGRPDEKMGQASPRLDADRTTERVRGAQSEGPVSSAEVQGAGRRGTARTGTQAVAPTIVAEADRAMESARTPGRYRALVRRYFQRLARLH
ncbi:MAG TPA: hypothetical protein VFW08_06000 [bacterium]|nr:hypothetical protein [bacterium]